MSDDDGAQVRARRAGLRFSIIAGLLACPPEQGNLKARIEELAARFWEDPTSKQPVSFGFSTIESWYYQARRQVDSPVETLQALTRKARDDLGTHPSISGAVANAIGAQYQEHPTWTYQLHYKNLRALARTQLELGTIPSYATILRYMKSHGLVRQKKKRRQSVLLVEEREKRSYEVRYPNQLWHMDFHKGPRPVLNSKGEWVYPWLAGAIDDHSRLVCHLQWYWVEDAQNLIHCFSQAVLKRGTPWGLMTDCGGAMKAAETKEGLMRLSVEHHKTEPYTPQQNGKKENFWMRVDTEFMPMLEGVVDLSLRTLNEATQAWVEREYNQRVHGETGQSPIGRFLEGENRGRPSPDSATLKDVFRMQRRRSQRRSDGTVSIEGVRFELPSRFRTLSRVIVRYARWDLSSADLIDERTNKSVATIYPLNRQRNAEQARRLLKPVDDPAAPAAPQTPRKVGIAPLLKQLMADYAASGLPAAYLPKDELT